MSQDAAGDKPRILQESQFTIEEGFWYRVLRTGAIWMNKLFLSTLFLLAVWLIVAGVSGDTGCVETVVVEGDQDVAGQQCSIFLTPTAKYLGGMALASFALSIILGFLGILVGRRVLETTATEDEVGARRTEGQDGPPGT